MMARSACIVLLANIVALSAHGDNILHEERSLYSRLVVKKTGTTICLQFNVRREHRNQSCIDTRKPLAMIFSYTRMSMASLLFTTEPQNILVIGLGGGTLPSAFHTLYPEAHIDAVEIEPAVVSVASEYFGFKASAQVRVHTRDARVWTKRAAEAERRYDIIVLDAFNGEYIPEHLMTQEYLQETKALLAPGGTLVANTFAISDLYDHESTTYSKVFGEFINFRIAESANRVIVVPGASLTNAQLNERAKMLAKTLKPFAVPIKRYARVLAKNRRQRPDWRTDARVLTDQYSPANLLQGR